MRLLGELRAGNGLLRPSPWIGCRCVCPADVNSVKRARMESFGARVTAVGRDSAECQEAARNHAAATPGCVFVQDGRDPAVAEGAGTIGIELLRSGSIDAIVLPVGDGALIAGVATWIKAHSPRTRVVGVCASRAPCMALSWRAGRPVSTERSDTIAEGIEVRVPVTESVARLGALVDDMVLVDDADSSAPWASRRGRWLCSSRRRAARCDPGPRSAGRAPGHGADRKQLAARTARRLDHRAVTISTNAAQGRP